MVLYVVVFLSSWLGPLGSITTYLPLHLKLTEDINCIPLLWMEIGTMRSFFSSGIWRELRFKYALFLPPLSQGTANSLVWFTNPTVLSAIRDQWCGSQGDGKDGSGFFAEIWRDIEDKKTDFNSLNLVLRKNMITCILLAIRHAVVKTRFPSSHSRSKWKFHKKLVVLSFRVIVLKSDSASYQQQIRISTLVEA